MLAVSSNISIRQDQIETVLAYLEAYEGDKPMPYVILKQPFDLGLSLSMGQAFRWRCWKPTNVDAREDDSSSGCWWSGVIGPYLVHLRDTEAEVEYRVVGPHGERKGLDMAGRLRRYFRDDDPIQDVYDSLKGDVTVGSLLREYPGMRVIRQDPWECLVTYVLTQGTLIERTKLDFVQKLDT